MKTLAEAYRDYFTIGAAVVPDTPQQHADLLPHFESFTAENDMKPALLHPSEEVYDFSRADLIANYTASHGLKLRGHTLVWHNQTPEWFFQDGDAPASRELALARMQSHIETVVGHFRGKAYCWDVVNEAISDDDEKPALRDTPWLRAVGDDYIAQAFHFAHKADPDCVLFYNEFNETRPIKAKRIYELVRDLRKDGVPVGGIGLQGHYNLYDPGMDAFAEAVELYASLGLPLQMTELDISLFAKGDESSLPAPTPELLERQAQYYGDLFAQLRKYAKYFTGVTFWNLADDKTWLSNFPVRGRKNWPLLFDENHQPKAEAYRRVVEF